MKEIKVPELAESIMEGTIADWLVGEGDHVQKGDPIVELETDKVNVEINSEFTGVIAEIAVGEGEDVVVGDVIGKIREGAEAEGATDQQDDGIQEDKTVDETSERTEQKEQAPTEKEDEGKAVRQNVIASPAARKRARELGIDLNDVQARDPLGRIRPDDVEAASARRVEQPII